MSSVETVDLWWIYSCENTPDSHKGSHNSLFSQYKQVIGRHGDHENVGQPILSYYVIYFEKVRKVMQQTEKGALNIDNYEWPLRISIKY